jgi:predicted 3-demethylubiquinone-9 3-methyltransferase (glyoxalase superfamily)
LGEMLSDPDPARSQRVMEAMLKMTKIEIPVLKQAYEGA